MNLQSCCSFLMSILIFIFFVVLMFVIFIIVRPNHYYCHHHHHGSWDAFWPWLHNQFRFDFVCYSKIISSSWDDAGVKSDLDGCDGFHSCGSTLVKSMSLCSGGFQGFYMLGFLEVLLEVQVEKCLEFCAFVTWLHWRSLRCYQKLPLEKRWRSPVPKRAVG